MISEVAPPPDYVIVQALEMIEEGALIIDVRRIVIYANATFAAITGYAREEILGRSCVVLHGPETDNEVVSAAMRALDTGQVFRGAMLHYRKDRSPFWNELTISPLRTPEGKITHFAVLIRDITDQKTLEDKLRFQAHHDPLTGLPNRTALAARLQPSLDAARLSGRCVAVGVLDLDDFKPVNDSFGHAAGDEILREMAQRLRCLVRETDFIARLGGDEFVVVLAGLDAAHLGRHLARAVRRLHRAVERPLSIKAGRSIWIKASLGVALFAPPFTFNGDQLIQKADSALYEAKLHKDGRRRWWNLWRDVPAREAGRPWQVTSEIQPGEGIGGLGGRLCMHIQPLVHLGTGNVTKLEALARLQLPGGTLLGPGEFLHTLNAEELAQLFREGLDMVLSWLRIWLDAGMSVAVSLNLPPIVLVMPECPQWTREALARHRIAPWQLELELLEHDERTGHACRITAIMALLDIGVHLVMDDLGSGFSSLERLYKLPFHSVKIDQNLILGAARNPAKAIPFIGTLIRLGQRIGMKVAVEGLESQELTEMAVALGADLGQGYDIARPMPPEEVLPWFRRHRWRVDLDELVTPLGRQAMLFSREALPMDWARNIAAHQDWKATFVRRASGAGRPLNWELIARDDACQLGHWLHRCGVGLAAENRPLYERVIRVHAVFHQRAAALARRLAEGEGHESVMAELQSGSLDKLSRRLVVLLQQLRERLSGRDGALEEQPDGDADKERMFRAKIEEQVARLTAREVSVLMLIARGSGNARIAAELGIAARTADAHTESIKRRLGFHSRDELRWWAARAFPEQALERSRSGVAGRGA